MSRRRAGRGRPAQSPSSPDRRADGPKPERFGLLLVRNLLLWIVPVALVWLLLTPLYNRFLETAGQNLLHLFESPNVTRLVPRDEHYALIARTDFPPDSDVVSSFRVTDLHFHVILLAALFLGTPRIPRRRRFADLGTALLATAFFHIALVVFWVQFTYATQLGDWSLEHYGPLARNFWGLGKHLLDLPVKLAVPLILWAAYYLPLLLPGDGPEENSRGPAV